MSANIVITGAAGFIGVYKTLEAIKDVNVKFIFLIDTNFDKDPFSLFKRQIMASDKVQIIEKDIMDLNEYIFTVNIHSIYHFAAIHREPGHQYFEYFAGNIPQLKRILRLSTKIGCRNIIFTSSIAVYGDLSQSKAEGDLLVPSSGYGVSKCICEEMLKAWQSESAQNKVLIARPGVVYGFGEGGNVDRLARLVKFGVVPRIGRSSAPKASVYVKELLNQLDFGMKYMNAKNKKQFIFNATYTPNPSIDVFIREISSAMNKNVMIVPVPYLVLIIFANLFQYLSAVLPFKNRVHPKRVEKYIKPNLVENRALAEIGYECKYGFKASIFDWIENDPRFR
jgi:nucleoside-diphosphate-sugar epimerase